MSLFRRSKSPAPGRQAQSPELSDQAPSRAETLLELAVLLGQQIDFQEILRLATAKARSLFAADIVSIVMHNPTTLDTAKTVIRQGGEIDQKHLHLLQTNVIGWVVKHRVAFISDHIASDARFTRDLFEGTPIRSVMCMPVQSERVMHGHVIVLNRENSRTFDAEDLSVLEKFAAVCAPFVSNAQRVREYFQPQVPDSALLAKYGALGLLGGSETFKEMLRAVESASRCDVRVFLEGESGTGKELVARAIHKLSARSAHPFVAIDCGAIPENLIESELFGHVKGAFTGATQSRKGLIEEADHGTLFMDEISNLPHEMQAKLLRVLQEGEIRPVGSNQTRKVDVRIIAASSRPAWESVENKSFREDLFFRLHVYPITLPALHDRADDIPILAAHFLKKYASHQQKKLEDFHPSLLNFMKHRSWAGHVRELESFVERLVTIAPAETSIIDQSILPKEFHKEFMTLSRAKSVQSAPQALEDLLDAYEEQIIRETLDNFDWNQSEAARALSVSEGTIRYKMERLGIVKPDAEVPASPKNPVN